jgi:hypothetical protein
MKKSKKGMLLSLLAGSLLVLGACGNNNEEIQPANEEVETTNQENMNEAGSEEGIDDAASEEEMNHSNMDTSNSVEQE